ncbi:C40 family peptidase [Corynebacterium pseudopelargi]|uniref:Putative endopeptidase n=1 Tax=Corynebacterium pseudopelargi TaxID=2080757 RepID=A0A3G6J0H9_9CORY|nr:C40 family peptidase [Corynebacterium pseudopelargi]AZA09870.1 putative endopeptidase precursor [Corynebacterium pseudopelargi]
MIPLEAGITMLRALMPSPPKITLPTPVDFASTQALAGIVEKQAQLPGQAALLASDIATVEAIVQRARPEFEAAAADIAHLGQQFLAEASVYIPKMLSANPALALSAATNMASLPGIYVEAAYRRLEEAQARLSADTATLEGIAAQEHQESYGHVGLGSSEGHASAEERARGRKALVAAQSQLGTPYVWGGTQPGGFDCSGLTSYAWRQAGVELPRLAEHQNVGRQVSQAELIEGDLLVWDGHVAMYAGNGQIIEAGSPVQMSPLRTTNMGMPFKGYYRPQG